MTKPLIEVLAVHPDGNCDYLQVAPTFESFKGIIGGWLEAIAGDASKWVCYGDEEGRLKNLPANPGAAMILAAMGETPSFMPVGTVVFAGLRFAGAENGYMDTDVPDLVRNAVDSLT